MPVENKQKTFEVMGDVAIIHINPKIHSLDVVYGAAYIMIDKAFIILDGDPNERIIAEIRKKNSAQDIQDIVREFYEELLNYSVYESQQKKNAGLREIILQRALMTNQFPSSNDAPISRDNTEENDKTK